MWQLQWWMYWSWREHCCSSGNILLCMSQAVVEWFPNFVLSCYVFQEQFWDKACCSVMKVGGYPNGLHLCAMHLLNTRYHVLVIQVTCYIDTRCKEHMHKRNSFKIPGYSVHCLPYSKCPLYIIHTWVYIYTCTPCELSLPSWLKWYLIWWSIFGMFWILPKLKLWEQCFETWGHVNSLSIEFLCS